MTSRSRAAGAVLAAVLLGGCDASWSWSSLWLTRDQQGARAFADRDYARAARRFEDPMRRGIALYYSEQFDAAIAEWARLPTADAWYCRGNALAHLERYEEAADAYRRALELRPDFPPAEYNLEYLRPFQPIHTEGGVTGTIGRDAAADEVVFDADAERLEESGRDTEPQEGGLLSEAQLEAMWLEQVDVSPATFLKQKFRFQAAAADREAAPEDAP